MFPGRGTLQDVDTGRRRERRVRGHEGEVSPTAGGAWADLGVPLGERATLVQFSTAFCAPCRATRRVLGEVAALVPGVAHVEIDAEARLDLVRRLDVVKTPTVLVLDAAGRIVRRATGQPRRADVIAALGEAV
ncbi:thiol-disulfide isomerase/thioredoxin [Streptomyces calvus]|uniref:TlpA family protein disulfide reductase n=1 Tax=Streptomyces calvus TaxID=67282 RepID=UPI0035138860